MQESNTYRSTRVEALARSLKAQLEGRASRPARIQVYLTGPIADAWWSMREEAEGLGLDDTTLFVLAIRSSARSVRAVLRRTKSGG